MKRIFNLSRFFYLDYWRRSRLLFQLLLLALTCGYFFDPRYAPYTLENVVFIKGIFLILIGYLTGYHLCRMNYDRRLYILLSRLSRRWIYLGSVLTAVLIMLGLGLLMDLYLLVFSGLSLSELFLPAFLVFSFFSILLAVVSGHFFSVYNVGTHLRVLGFIIIGLGTIPNWYLTFPLEDFLKYLSYLLPPLGSIINAMMEGEISFSHYIYPLFYSLLLLTAGIRVWEKRSLTDLY